MYIVYTFSQLFLHADIIPEGGALEKPPPPLPPLPLPLPPSPPPLRAQLILNFSTEKRRLFAFFSP